MSWTLTVVARGVIALLLMVLLAIQAVIIPAFAAQTLELNPEVGAWAPVGAVWAIAAVASGEAILLIVWRLLAMAAEGSIFEPRAFAVVGAMIWCAVAFTALMAAGLIGDIVAGLGRPVIVLFVLGGVLAGAASILVIAVLKALLGTAARLHDEIAEVI